MTPQHTPLMQQYHQIKAEHPDTILMFQVGDFYELFFDDAKIAAAYLGIALTSRGKSNGEDIPLCGVPIHAKDHYLTKLIKGGFKVAICDQLEEATPGKLVRRSVTQVLTPGTLTDATLLDDKSASYLFAFYPGEHEWALVFGELLTAQLWATVIPAKSDRILESELSRFFPDELLVPNIKDAKQFIPFFKQQGYFTTVVEMPTDQEIPQLPVTMKNIVDEHSSLSLALKYFYAYLKKNQIAAADQFTNLFMYQPDDFLHLDASTQRNLELIKNNYDGGRSHTLFSVMDGATTPMGSRMIKKWLQRPLLKQQAIIQRQEVIADFIKDVICLQTIQQLLIPLGDVERVIGRIALGRAQVHDYLALRTCLSLLPAIKQQLDEKQYLVLCTVIQKHIADFGPLYDFLQRALPAHISNDQIVASGFDASLDHMRDLINNSTIKMLALEQREQAATGIQSLKIRYNNVHGYYIEITNANKDSVPDRYIRRQTLVGKERYTIAELQQLEAEIMHARSQVEQRENELFEAIKRTVYQEITALRKLAHALAHLDALHGFAKIAYNNGYIQPQFKEGNDITIIQGRHPIIERDHSVGFIANDTHLNDQQSLWIITGPNMGGKSTYLRQVALICIMAQCGSFVPAKAATLPMIDRIFTRIGAGDNLAAGKSTFLVEMEETASICTQATAHSLVILDEVGRGTSTFDGLAIAQAVVEYLYHTVKPRCLFATHYHELTQLSKQLSGVASFYMASKKTDTGILFLYAITQGVADGSFGVEVAKLADLPPQVVSRAQEILKILTAREQGIVVAARYDTAQEPGFAALMAENAMLKKQAKGVMGQAHVIEALRQVNFNELSPKQAFDLLWQWKDLA